VGGSTKRPLKLPLGVARVAGHRQRVAGNHRSTRNAGEGPHTHRPCVRCPRACVVPHASSCPAGQRGDLGHAFTTAPGLPLRPAAVSATHSQSRRGQIRQPCTGGRKAAWNLPVLSVVVGVFPVLDCAVGRCGPARENLPLKKSALRRIRLETSALRNALRHALRDSAPDDRPRKTLPGHPPATLPDNSARTLPGEL